MNRAALWRQMSGRERLEVTLLGLRTLIPHLTILLGFFLVTLPFFAPLPAIPNFGLVLAYLFALYRPAQLSAASTVPLGLAADILIGTPLGANGLLMPLFILSIVYFDTKTRRVHWGFDWLAAVPFIALYQLALWRLCLFAGPDSPVLPFLTQAFATLAAFPLVTVPFVFLQRRFVDGIK